MQTMPRETWTDDRMDDLVRRVDVGFDQVDRRFEQVDRRFDQVHADIRALQADVKLATREELKAEVAELRGEMVERFERAEGRADARTDAQLYMTMRIGAGIVGSILFGIFGVIATQL